MTKLHLSTPDKITFVVIYQCGTVLIIYCIRYDEQNRGKRPFFVSWRYLTELNNVHCQLLALESRRNDRSRFKACNCLA